MKKSRKKKETLYVCVVCGNEKKASRKVKCCGKDMLSRDKGSWNL